FATAPAGDVFIGTQLGLYRADPEGRGVTRVALPEREATASVEALLLDDEQWWIGSFADGLSCYAAPRAGAPPRLLQRFGADRLTDLRVNAIERGADGVLWVGTNNGLNRVDPAGGGRERIAPPPADPRALSAGTITSLLRDAQGRLWIGTLGGGLD